MKGQMPALLPGSRVMMLGGIALRKAFFISRQHAALPCTPVGPLKKCGKVETGTFLEQPVEIALADGEVLKLQRDLQWQ